ncbi:MAG: DUF4065 domain-containing protein, partial [Pseudomonadales bacterium]
PITGATYIRMERGPVPNDGEAIRRQMVADGLISQKKERYYSYDKWRFKSLSSPLANVFSEDEKATIDYWIKHIDEDHTAESISDESHDYAWEVASMGEALPLTAIFANRVRDPNSDERAWAEKIAREKQLP